MEYLLLGTSIQGIPPFRGHKIWSWKNVSHIIFISVTFTEGTPFFNVEKKIVVHTPPPSLPFKVGVFVVLYR